MPQGNVMDIVFDEAMWDSVLALIEDGQVVPVIGPGLFRKTEGTEEEDFYHWLGVRLAEKLGLEAPTGKGLAALEILVRRCPTNKRVQLYPLMRNIVQNATFPMPESLRLLAEITSFDLFVTTTFDSMLADALAKARPATQVLSLAYAPRSKWDDLPAGAPSRERPIVYHLFGKVSVLPNFVLCEEDALEFMASLQSGTHSPERLAGLLRDRHLLMLGCEFPDWMARFFMQMTIRPGQRLSDPVSIMRVVADTNVSENSDLALFLNAFSSSTRIFAQGDAIDFCRELHRRWSAMRTSTVETPVAASPKPLRFLPPETEMPAGAVFISYSREDMEAVKRLKNCMDETGIIAWFDLERLEAGDDYVRKIQQNIRNCAYFIPVISRSTCARDEAFFVREWKWAIERTEGMREGAVFILPVVIDDTDPNHASVPKAFKERIHVTKATGGALDKGFLERLQGMLGQKKAMKEETAPQKENPTGPVS